MIQNNKLLYWHNLSQGWWIFDRGTSPKLLSFKKKKKKKLMLPIWQERIFA